MSKIRNHANLKLNANFDLNPVSLDPKGSPERIQEPYQRPKVTPHKKLLEQRKKSNQETEKEIVDDLKLKLSLTSILKIKPKKKPEQEYNSYENPNFCHDSSLDSSMSSFFHELDKDEELPIEEPKIVEPKIEEPKIEEKCEEPLTILMSSAKIRCRKSSSHQNLSELEKKEKNEKSKNKSGVDNLTSFWNNTRGNSFRSRKHQRKKMAKSMKDLNTLEQEHSLSMVTSDDTSTTAKSPILINLFNCLESIQIQSKKVFRHFSSVLLFTLIHVRELSALTFTRQEIGN